MIAWIFEIVLASVGSKHEENNNGNTIVIWKGNTIEVLKVNNESKFDNDMSVYICNVITESLNGTLLNTNDTLHWIFKSILRKNSTHICDNGIEDISELFEPHWQLFNSKKNE